MNVSKAAILLLSIALPAGFAGNAVAHEGVECVIIVSGGHEDHGEHDHENEA